MSMKSTTLLLVALLCSYPAFAANQKIRDWKSSSRPFVKIPVSECWESISFGISDIEQYPPEVLILRPSSRCESKSGKDWEIIFSSPNEKTKTEILHNFPPPPRGYSFLKEITLNGRIVRFYRNVQNTLAANFSCGNAYFDLENYGFHFTPSSSYRQNSDADVPQVFKDFISSIKCI